MTGHIICPTCHNSIDTSQSEPHEIVSCGRCDVQYRILEHAGYRHLMFYYDPRMTESDNRRTTE